MENGLTHFDKEGNAVMVDVSGKTCYLSDCTGNRIYCGRSGDHGMRYGGKCQKRRCPWRGEGGWNHGREKNI